MTDAAIEFRASDVGGLGRSILTTLGAPDAAAQAVADHLITAHLMGLVSHGVIRFAQYTRDVRNGRIDPTAVPAVISESPTLGVVDGCGGFGQVTAGFATQLAVTKARDVGIAIVTTRRCNHIGRLGAFVEQAARSGVVALAVTAVPRTGHFVVPWGGRDGRLGTNPIAFGFPTSGDPIVGDFATSVIPEGRVRAARNKGVPLPEGAVRDAEGRPTLDPAAFYGPPMGTLQPFGGSVGHKGYGLGVFAELLGATLSKDMPEDDERSINGYAIIAIDAGAFAHPTAVDETADALVAYLRSSRPTPEGQAVMVPGEPEFTALHAAGDDPRVALDTTTWHDLEEIARSLDIATPTPVGSAVAG
jgi:uncharacterized oxidoreductase